MKSQVGKRLSLAANLTRGDEHTLLEEFPIGSRVRVANYSPFRGLKGTIRAVNIINDDLEEPFCFYLVAVDGVQLKEPIWFEYTEVELIAPPPS